LAASVVALDYSVIGAASDGRMEMMCLALGEVGLAVFAMYRDSEWSKAFFVGACCGAASLLCHPMGLVTNACMAVLVLMDWRRLRLNGVLLAALAYLIAGAVCIWYIWQAPDIFHAQSEAASAYRVSGAPSVVRNVVNDLYIRYFYLYFFGIRGIFKLKAASLLFALLGCVGAISNRRLRSRLIVKVLLCQAIVAYILVAALDNQKFPIYFVYTLPIMSACAAVWVYDEWSRSNVRRFFATSLLIASLLAGVGGFAYKIKQNEYAGIYAPAIDAIKVGLKPGGIVMGGSELGFALGFTPHLVDDRYLGYFSGKRPDVYVENQYYGGMGAGKLGEAWTASRAELASDYHLIFQNRGYRVYVRNSSQSRIEELHVLY